MTAIRALLQEAYLTFEKGRFWGELIIIPAACIAVWAIAAFGVTALSSALPMEPASPSPPYGLQSHIAGER